MMTLSIIAEHCTLRVTHKSLTLSVIMLNVIVLSVVMLRVMAPRFQGPIIKFEIASAAKIGG